MPLFGNKFSPKAAAPRKSPSLSNLSNDPAFREAELGLDYGPIKINLGNNEVTFEDGQWISETSGAASVHREMAKIQKENQVLNEENNLLKLKVEMLLDLLPVILAGDLNARTGRMNDVLAVDRYGDVSDECLEVPEDIPPRTSQDFTCNKNDLAETTAEVHLQENEIEQLKAMSKNKR